MAKVFVREGFLLEGFRICASKIEEAYFQEGLYLWGLLWEFNVMIADRSFCSWF